MTIKKKNVFSSLGVVYSVIGLIGSVAMVVSAVFMQPQYRVFLFAGTVFPIFLLLGGAFLIIGRKRESQEIEIRRNGTPTNAVVIKILKRYGSRPVRMRSTYCAEVELSINNQTVHSRMFFTGRSFAKVESYLQNKQSIPVMYYDKIPQQVLWDDQFDV